MLIDIKNKTEIVETRNVYQVNVLINDEKCSIRKEETVHGYDVYVLYDSIGVWVDVYDIKDISIRNAIQKIGYNIELDVFKKEQNDIDLDTLPTPVLKNLDNSK